MPSSATSPGSDDFHDVLPTDVPGSSTFSYQGSSQVYVVDPTYYCQDIVILVEGVLFRVPRGIFEQSEAFQDMFRVPPPGDVAVDGSDNDHPLHLEGYLADDFRQLLRVILPMQHGIPDPLTSDQWVSVLKLSTIWGFHSVRSTAMGKLATFASDDPILKVILAKKYNVPDWFMPSLTALAQRDEPLGYVDFERLREIGSTEYAVDFLLRIARVRETCLQPAAPIHYCTDREHCSVCNVKVRSNHDFSAAIRKVFASETQSEDTSPVTETSQTSSTTPSPWVSQSSSPFRRRRGRY